MKQFIVSFCLLITILLPTFANPVTEDSARIKAEQFFTYKRNNSGRRLAKTTSDPKVSCVKRSSISENDDATYYIFSQKGNYGYVILSGDDNMPALIGYSLENNIDVENMPKALKLMLDDYDIYVKRLRKNGKASTRSNVGPLEPGTPVVGPYITTKWNQWEPYNWLTPDYYDGKRTPSGCVPTAAAQILNYYKYPYIFHQYKWEIMRDKYLSNYSHAEGMEVAKLMRDLGSLMGTTYKSSGSSTGSHYFRIPGLVHKGYNSDSLTTQLIEKGPIVVSGWAPGNNSEPHAFIIDGYDSNGYYHVNWGWGGLYDGYYQNLSLHGPGFGQSVYFFKPDYDNPAAIPAAYGGVSINKETAQIGDVIELTLHQVKLLSSSNFDGSLSCHIYKIKENEYNNYSGEGFYGEELNYYNHEDFKYPSIPWQNVQQGEDVKMEIKLEKINKNGYYVIVPKYYNKLERGSMSRPLIQFADGTLQEDIPFEYNDGKYIFKKIAQGDFNIDVSQIVTASTYTQGGQSSILPFMENNGKNNFTGKLTTHLVNPQNSNDTRTLDFDLYLPAKSSIHTPLYSTFNFTGSYRIQQIEVWSILPSGERKTYLNKSINGTSFTILPFDSQAVTTDFYSKANIQILWRNDTAYVNDSIYKYEEASIEFYAYSLDADTAAIDAELWAVPVNDGLPSLLKKKNYPLSKQHFRTQKIGGSTASLSPGSYYLIAFGRCGNNTNIFSKPDTIGQGYKYLYDKITDNIIHVFDPGVDVPILKLHSLKQINDLYFGEYGYTEAEIENMSDVDYCGNTSSCLSVGNNSYMSVSSTLFRIKAKQTATIWPKLYQYKDYEGTGGYSEGNFTYKMNNGVRDLTIPIEGDFFVNFTEKPENIISVSSGIAFYYKNNLSIKPSLGFYSKGTLKRSLWKNNEIIMNLDDLQTDSTYNTYKVCPEAAEIKGLPSGNYLLIINLIDNNGEHPVIVYPLIIDDKELPLTIEKVSFDTNRSFSYEGDMPVVVTIKNPTQQDVSTLVSTEIRRKVDGKNSWWVDSRELHPITLPAMQSTTINLNTHILSTSTNIRQDGTFKVYVNVCRTERESGHLDFGSSKGSDTIELPYVSNGITLNTYESHHIPTAYYTIDGKRVTTPPHGLYIVKYNDGTVKKMHR